MAGRHQHGVSADQLQVLDLPVYIDDGAEHDLALHARRPGQRRICRLLAMNQQASGDALRNADALRRPATNLGTAAMLRRGSRRCHRSRHPAVRPGFRPARRPLLLQSRHRRRRLVFFDHLDLSAESWWACVMLRTTAYSSGSDEPLAELRPRPVEVVAAVAAGRQGTSTIAPWAAPQ